MIQRDTSDGERSDVSSPVYTVFLQNTKPVFRLPGKAPALAESARIAYNSGYGYRQRKETEYMDKKLVRRTDDVRLLLPLGQRFSQH